MSDEHIIPIPDDVWELKTFLMNDEFPAKAVDINITGDYSFANVEVVGINHGAIVEVGINSNGLPQIDLFIREYTGPDRCDERKVASFQFDGLTLEQLPADSSVATTG